MALIITGIDVSKGIAIGDVHLLKRGAPEVFEHKLKKNEIKQEVERFQNAVDEASNRLRNP